MGVFSGSILPIGIETTTNTNEETAMTHTTITLDNGHLALGCCDALNASGVAKARVELGSNVVSVSYDQDAAGEVSRIQSVFS